MISEIQTTQESGTLLFEHIDFEEDNASSKAELKCKMN